MNSITKKSEDISGWYNEVVEQAALVEHGPVKGTMIWRPLGYAVWEAIQKNLDARIKNLGAQNVYFPLFIPESFLKREKEHVKGFSPELAVVTHGGGEKLKEPIVVRPTSETIMYDAFSRWIQSYRDLPLLINQWANVVRWELRPYYFLRTTEFLWQEGHTAHETEKDAQKTVDEALSLYVDFYQNVLGLFGYAGRKSDAEKFPGADKTFTYEILMPDGKVVQGCTSHNLGQNFSKVFNVKFQTDAGTEEFVYQTSWGFSSRSIGAMILMHGDDNGLIFPPLIAPVQVVNIPIVSKGQDSPEIIKLAQKAFEALEKENITVRIDNSQKSAGWKFNQYDLEGVPLRIEIGPGELKNRELSIRRRDKKIGSIAENTRVSSLEDLSKNVKDLLSQIQKELLEKSKQFTIENTRDASSYEQFKEIMSTSRGFIRAFWCENPECEKKIKEETKASNRCLSLGSAEEKGECIYCKKPSKYRWLFAQSY